MAEYIDKQAAIKAILGQPPEAHFPVWYASDIMDIPPADVRPVVHGTWEFMETENIWSHADLSHFYIQCSICKSQFFTDTPKLRFAYEFCPCCGADMREDEP